MMMKSALLLSTLLASASSFGVAPTTTRGTATSLNALIPEADRDTNQNEIATVVEKWNSIRHLSTEEIEGESDEWKEAHARYYEKYNADMESMTNIATKIQNMIEPPKVQRKTEGQRRRDKWAMVQARAAARAKKK